MIQTTQNKGEERMKKTPRERFDLLMDASFEGESIRREFFKAFCLGVMMGKMDDNDLNIMENQFNRLDEFFPVEKKAVNAECDDVFPNENGSVNADCDDVFPDSNKD